MSAFGRCRLMVAALVKAGLRCAETGGDLAGESFWLNFSWPPRDAGPSTSLRFAQDDNFFALKRSTPVGTKVRV